VTEAKKPWSGQTSWFSGEPEVVEKELVPYRRVWLCPEDDCDGEMKFNGFTWPTADPGYHHTCTKCGFTAAVHAKYPGVGYKEKK
jgi:hypothetical protein